MPEVKGAKRWRGAALLPTVVATAVALTSAQQPEPPKPTFRTGVSTVRVDVSVTGRDGTPVRDLTAADFTLEDEGVAQVIDTCQFVALTGERLSDRDESLVIRSPEHAEAEAARDDVRLIALFLDDYHIDKTPAITLPLRRSLTDFVRQLGPNDLVAIADPLTPMSALELTRDRYTLEERVRKFEGRQGELFPFRSVLEEAQAESRNIRRVRAEVTLSALAGLVVKMGSLREGRKSIVFVSQGPPTFFGRMDADIEYRMRDVLEAASRGNVTIHAVDPRGLGMEGRGGVRDTLYRLASETGGRATVNTNDLVGGLRDVIRDASAYYLLGYTPTRDVADGKFHKIKVGVTRKGIDVLARKGYWAPKAEDAETAAAASSKPAVPGVADALALLAVSKTPRAVDTWVGSTFEDGRRELLVTWNARERPQGPQDARAVVRVDVEVLGPSDGAAVGAPQALVSSDAADGQSMARVAWQESGTRLRFTARDAGGDVVDRWTERVEDRSSTQRTLDDLRVYRALSPLALKALRANPSPVPTASRTFRRTDRVLADVAADADVAARLGVELLNSAGDVLSSLPLTIAHVDGRVQSRFEVPVASLGLGRYVLRARVHVGDTASETLTAFDVVR